VTDLEEVGRAGHSEVHGDTETPHPHKGLAGGDAYKSGAKQHVQNNDGGSDDRTTSHTQSSRETDHVVSIQRPR